MLININGKLAEVADKSSLHDLLNSRGINQKAVILELNGQIIRSECWSATALNQNDKLEIIRIIGGG
jgi:sulfur carrier protein